MSMERIEKDGEAIKLQRLPRTDRGSAKGAREASRKAIYRRFV
jgi:hypothetical protein